MERYKCSENRLNIQLVNLMQLYQLDKMNVLFIGVDNPMTISGSGDVEQLQVSASGGGAVLSGGWCTSYCQGKSVKLMIVLLVLQRLMVK